MENEAEVVQLKTRIAELEQKLAEVLAQLETATNRIAELERLKTPPPAWLKPNKVKVAAEKKARRKREAKFNNGRKLEIATQTQVHALDHCGECGYHLRGQSLSRIRQVIDLPPPRPVEIRDHQILKRWCPKCEKWREPKLDLTNQVLGQGRMGLGIVSLVAYLTNSLRMTVRQVVSYLKALHQLQVSSGEISQLLQSLAESKPIQTELAALLSGARASPIVHADETAWRESGQNGYIWALITPEGIHYYHYEKSRESWVIKNLLSNEFKGHLSSDFYAGYNIYPGKHQRCWVHLLRDLHKLKEMYPEDKAIVEWARAVRQLYDEGQSLVKGEVEPGPIARGEKYIKLVEDSHILGLEYAQFKDHPCQALAKRLLRHEEELFQFVLVPGLSADNNLAERGVRPMVVMRKISGGSRSERGSKTRMNLSSLFQTWVAKGLEPLSECRKLLGYQTLLPQL
jgi:transposase